MKNFFLCSFISLIFLHHNCSAQSSGLNYSFFQSAGTMVYNNSSAGAVTAIPGGVDDQVATITPSFGWAGFYFAGKWFPQNSTLYVSSNGWMSFVNPLGNSLPVNSLWTSPYFTIAPLWDDLKVHPGGEVSAKLTGSIGTQCLVVEWKGMLWDRNATDSALSFQVLLYDNEQTNASMRNVIEFRYKRNGTDSSFVINNSGGASIGISGGCSDVLAFSNSTGAPNYNVPENSHISLKPSDAVIHRFTPQPHPNDECAFAEILAFDPALPLISTYASTLQTTQSAGNLPSCGNPSSINDVWFTFTKPPGITNFEIYTDSLDCRGVNYKPGIELFSSCGGGSIECDFGSTGPGNTNASSYINIVNQSYTAQQYWVRAYMLDSSIRGYFRLNIRSPGRTCENANDFSWCNLPYTSASGLTTCGFGNEYDSTNSAAHSSHSSGTDYVFSYTPPGNVCVDISLSNTPLNTSPGIFLSMGCPDSGIWIASATGSGGSTIGFNNISLTTGNTYYFVIDNDTLGNTGCLSSFKFSVSLSVSSAPPNDNCMIAYGIPVQVFASCTGAIDFSNICARPEPAGSIPIPSCGTFTDGVTGDVWFKFTSVNTDPHVIKVDTGSIPSAEDLALAVYSGSCGTLTLIDCNDNGNGMMPALSGNPPASGLDYFVRVWSNSGTQPGNFRICVRNGPTAINDILNDEKFISVAPNPASEKATIFFDKNIHGSFDLKVIDLTGRTILAGTTTPTNENNSSQLNLEGITEGIYLLHVENKDHSAFAKLIINEE